MFKNYAIHLCALLLITFSKNYLKLSADFFKLLTSLSQIIEYQHSKIQIQLVVIK